MHKELPTTYDELARDNKLLRARLDELEELVRFLRRGRFAASSEKLLHPGMRPLFEDQAPPPEEEASEKVELKVKEHTRKILRKALPEALPRENVYCDLAEQDKTCACCQQAMTKTHEKSSEKLHVKPAEFIVKKFIMPVYACKTCEVVKQAKMPAHPIAKCSVTSDTLAHIAVSKYIDGLPLHRLEKIFQREAVDIKRDKMSRWLIALSEKLSPLKDLLHKDLLAGGFMAMDETSIQVLKEKDRRPDQKSFMLVQAYEGPPGRNITLFHYEKSRSAETVGRYLHGFSGSLITDGLGVYTSYCSTRSSISHGGCMSHARRKFTDAAKGKKGNKLVAKTAIALMAELFKIEAELKGKAPEERLAIRQEKSSVVMEKLESLWLTNIDSITAKSLTGKALHYLKNQWVLLSRFLDDPNLPMHNNYLERQIRPLAVGRRAWLFADTMAGAHASSVFYSLLNTAKENGLNPLTYLADVLVKIESASDLRTLLPYA